MSDQYPWLSDFDVDSASVDLTSNPRLMDTQTEAYPMPITGEEYPLSIPDWTPFMGLDGNHTVHESLSMPTSHASGSIRHVEAIHTPLNFDMTREPMTAHQHRSLPRRRSKYVLRRSGSRTRAIAIPNSNQRRDESESLTMRRWHDSPPEDEAVPLSTIYNAVQNQPHNTSRRSDAVQNAGSFQTCRIASSTASYDSGTSLSSLESDNSSLSTASNASGTVSPLRSRSRVPARRQRKSKGGADRAFKCTFCCDTFKHKYDWARHEKSLHLNLEEWLCTPHGGSVIMPLTGRLHCAYCNILDPTTDHLEEHNHNACQNESGTRTFRRKDHLVQHLRLVHHLDTLPLIDDWKIETGPVVSRCGFCNATLNSWDERTEHLASHFRKGKTMADWRGDHGFDPNIAGRVTNSMAPYLIASESITLVPYSATTPASMDLFNQISSQINRLGAPPPEVQTQRPEMSTTMPLASDAGRQSQVVSHGQNPPSQQEIDTIVFTEVLTRHLSRFARQQISVGIVPTDEMFQRESRRVLYDSNEDDWEQTVADNSDWLAAFRQQYGLQS